MVPHATKLLSLSRYRSISIRNYHVAVVGGAGEVGRTLSVMLRAQPSVTKLTIHDVQDITPGVVLDLSHIPAASSLTGYSSEETLERAIKGSDIVIATGGTILKPDMSETSWFTANTEFIKNFATKVAKITPLPFIGIVTEPINTLVPMAAEILKSHNNYDPKKLFGITTVDVLTAQSIYAFECQVNPKDCVVPVIGGHSAKTMVPLLSQSKPTCDIDDKEQLAFANKIRKASENVTIAYKGYSPTLSVAYSVLLFARSVMDALDGSKVRINAFVDNNDFGTHFFSGSVLVDHDGIEEMQRYDNMSKYELYLLEKSIEQIRKDVMKGKKNLEIAES